MATCVQSRNQYTGARKPYTFCGTCKTEKSKNEFYKATPNRCIECSLAQVRKSHLKRTYGITFEEYDFMLDRQNGVCAICKGVHGRRLAVDHNHETGKVRGLLCGSCNAALFLLEDSILRE